MPARRSTTAHGENSGISGGGQAAVAPGAEQAVKIRTMVGVLVGDDDSVKPFAYDGTQRGQQPRQRAVAKVDDDPSAGGGHQEPAARTTGFRPRCATAEHS